MSTPRNSEAHARDIRRDGLGSWMSPVLPLAMILPAESLKSAFAWNMKLKGFDTSGKFGQAIVQRSAVHDGLDSIRRALSDGDSQIAAAAAWYWRSGTHSPDSLITVTR